jgi:hypothetical protein
LRPISNGGNTGPITQRDLVQALLDIARLQEQIKASDRALTLADAVLEQWKHGTNEWRQENVDQRNLFPTKDRVDGLIDTVNGRINTLEKQGAKLSGVWAVVVLLWPVAVALAFYLLAHR